MLVVNSYKQNEGFSVIGADELFFINGGSGAPSGGSATSNGSSTGQAVKEAFIFSVLEGSTMDAFPSSDVVNRNQEQAQRMSGSSSSSSNSGGSGK